jgi:amidohydrolase
VNIFLCSFRRKPYSKSRPIDWYCSHNNFEPAGAQMKTAKTGAQEKVGQLRDPLVNLSHRIHAHPELGFEEEKASLWLEEMLADAGMKVESRACDIPTAFIARAGSGPLHIAICAEYDALPGIGHACSHNIIAATAAGAGVALAKVADEIGITVSVIGTPAEEIGDASGKILLLERGGFHGVHAAMMVHPAPFDMIKLKIIAASMFEVKYTGKEAHASAFPEMGINAADALTVAQVSLGLLRQHIRQTDRIHGITTHGGDAPNVVPAHTSARYIIRGENLAELAELRPKVLRCFEAGARHWIEARNRRRPETVRGNARRYATRRDLRNERSRIGSRISGSWANGYEACRLNRYGQRIAHNPFHSPDDRSELFSGGKSPAGIHSVLRYGNRGQSRL